MRQVGKLGEENKKGQENMVYKSKKRDSEIWRKKGVCNRNKNLKEDLQFGSIFKNHALWMHKMATVQTACSSKLKECKYDCWPRMWQTALSWALTAAPGTRGLGKCFGTSHYKFCCPPQLQLLRRYCCKAELRPFFPAHTSCKTGFRLFFLFCNNFPLKCYKIQRASPHREKPQTLHISSRNLELLTQGFPSISTPHCLVLLTTPKGRGENNSN